jgi:four helix bundle suffix protein
MRRLEESFVKEGGFTERLYQARMKNRRSQTSGQLDGWD